MRQITPADLKALLDAGAEPLLLLDVREPEEFDICRIENSLLMPMRSVPTRLAELPQDKAIVCICHHGGRSNQVAMYLASNGFDNVINLSGGVHRWAQDVEPAMPTY